MTATEVKAFNAICSQCRRAAAAAAADVGRKAHCLCRLQTMVTIGQECPEESQTSDEFDSQWSSVATASLAKSGTVRSNAIEFRCESPEFTDLTELEAPPSDSTRWEENRSNLELQHKPDQLVSIPSSQSSEINQDTIVAEAHSPRLPHQLSMEAGSRRTLLAAALVQESLAADLNAELNIAEPEVSLIANSCLRRCGRGSSSDSEKRAGNFPLELETSGVDEVALGRAYDKTLEPYVQLHRTVVDPLDNLLDMRLVRRNFKLVKLRQHPMQIATESARLEDVGVSRLDQLLQHRMELFHKKLLIQGRERSIEGRPAFPDWIPLRLRLMKRFANLRWKLFVMHRQKLRQAEPNNIERMANVKESHRYNPKYIDVWTARVSVMVKVGVPLRDVITAAFVRLGLDKRADFRYSVKCFLNDHRYVGPNGEQRIDPIEVFEATPVRNLYLMNVSEVFINVNKREMFDNLPESVHGFPGYGQNFKLVDSPQEVQRNKKRGGFCCRRR